MIMRTLENCGHIKIALKKGMKKPQQEEGKCAGFKDNSGDTMYACSRCKLYRESKSN